VRLVPICWDVVTIWSAEVSRKNLLLLAQFWSNVEAGSPPVIHLDGLERDFPWP